MPADHTASPAEIFARCAAMDASLPEQLAAFWQAIAAIGPDFAAEAEALVARLKEHEVGDTAPKPGEPMPPFALPDTTGRIVDLDGLLADGPAIVIFHRGHWCPFCRMSSLALGRAQDRIAIPQRLGPLVAWVAHYDGARHYLQPPHQLQERDGVHPSAIGHELLARRNPNRHHKSP